MTLKIIKELYLLFVLNDKEKIDLMILLLKCYSPCFILFVVLVRKKSPILKAILKYEWSIKYLFNAPLTI